MVRNCRRYSNDGGVPASRSTKSSTIRCDARVAEISRFVGAFADSEKHRRDRSYLAVSCWLRCNEPFAAQVSRDVSVCPGPAPLSCCQRTTVYPTFVATIR